MQKLQNLPIPTQLRRKANIIFVEKSYRQVIRWERWGGDQVGEVGKVGKTLIALSPN